MKYTNLLPSLIAVLVLSGCASTEYKTYEGRNTVYEGEGGTRSTINGIDFWENGEPPRKFKIIGIIDDERPSGILAMAMQKGSIAKKAKAAGGDGVLLLSSGSQLRGVVTNASAETRVYGNTASTTASALSVPVFHNSASYVVIKYVE